jgi:hypothetical protein
MNAKYLRAFPNGEVFYCDRFEENLVLSPGFKKYLQALSGG